MESGEVHVRPYAASFIEGVPSADIDRTALPLRPVGGDEAKSSNAYHDQLMQATVPIRKELERVDQMLRRELQVGQTHLSELLAYVSELGGKRLRPCLLLLAAKASGVASEESIRLSVVVELVHTATLLHTTYLT